MKFEAKYRPELCASDDETRTHLVHVHLDTKKSAMVATNGHVLVKVPCKPESGDSDGAVSPAALREARTVARKKRYAKPKGDDGMPCVRVGKKLLDTGGAIYRRQTGTTFPPWEHILPKFKAGDKGTFSFGVNPQYLLDVARAIGAYPGDSSLVRITVSLTELEPIIVEPGNVYDREPGVIAIVMPGRVG